MASWNRLATSQRFRPPAVVSTFDGTLYDGSDGSMWSPVEVPSVTATDTGSSLELSTDQTQQTNSGSWEYTEVVDLAPYTSLDYEVNGSLFGPTSGSFDVSGFNGEEIVGFGFNYYVSGQFDPKPSEEEATIGIKAEAGDLGLSEFTQEGAEGSPSYVELLGMSLS